MGADHFYTTDSTGELALKAGYTYEGVQCYVAKGSETATVPTFRYYNDGSNDHFYTTNQSEGTRAAPSWHPEFVGWYMFPPPADNPPDINAAPPGPPGTIPLFRKYLGNTDHFYTTDKAEAIRAGGNYEGVAGYVFPATAPPEWAHPLYRWFKG
jgi:hypothetical protein